MREADEAHSCGCGGANACRHEMVWVVANQKVGLVALYFVSFGGHSALELELLCHAFLRPILDISLRFRHLTGWLPLFTGAHAIA